MVMVHKQACGEPEAVKLALENKMIWVASITGDGSIQVQGFHFFFFCTTKKNLENWQSYCNKTMKVVNIGAASKSF